MKVRRGLALLASLLLAALLRGALPPEPARNAPLPSWTRPADCDPASASREAVPTVPSGLEFLVVDRQFDVASETEVYRCAYRVCSETALEQESNLIVDFDPEYEKIDYNFVRVWRNGRPRDALAGAEVKLIQQEKDLERNLYNGRVSALLMIPDLRIGDVVDYAFTRRGQNPVFAGRFAEQVAGAWAVPVRLQHLLVISPADRPLQAREEGKVELKASVRAAGGNVEYEWTGRDLKPIAADADTPSWCLSYGYIDLTEFADWRAVEAWAVPLFRLPEPDASMRSLVASLIARPADAGAPGQAGTSPDSPAERRRRAAAVLDFVQRQVRYLGIEMGPGSHKPTDPAVVLARRYGDCKDKALLLCTLLSACGIKAQPVLVSSWRRTHARECLPGPFAFNHCIARIRLDGEYVYVDPTQSSQRGGLRTRQLGYDTCGLPIDPGATALVDIRASADCAPRVSVGESLSFSSYDGPCKAEVKFVYLGSVADAMRAYLASVTREEAGRGYLNYYKDRFPLLEPSGDLRWSDDPEAGRVTVDFAFTVPGVWSRVPGEVDKRKAEFWPLPLRKYFRQPESLVRKAPLAREHPIEVEVTTTVNMPDEWASEEHSSRVASAQFVFTHEIRSAGRQVVVRDRWRSLDDSVPADQISAYVAKLAQVRDDSGAVLTRDLDLTRRLQTAGANNLMVVLVLATLLAGGGLAFLGLRREKGVPPLLPSVRTPPLGGWLVLLAIGIVLSLSIRVYGLVGQLKTLLDERVWVRMSLPANQASTPHWGLLASIETVAMLLLLCWTIVVTVLFFRRKKRAPKAYIALLVGNFCFVLFEAFLNFGWHPNIEPELAVRSIASVVGSVAATVLWTWYLLVSERVKRTFVR